MNRDDGSAYRGLRLSLRDAEQDVWHVRCFPSPTVILLSFVIAAACWLGEPDRLLTFLSGVIVTLASTLAYLRWALGRIEFDTHAQRSPEGASTPEVP